MRCRTLSYVHTNFSQENSASVFRVEVYFTADDKKASQSSETVVSTKLHGVICRSIIISAPLRLHKNLLIRLSVMLLFLLTPTSFFRHHHDSLRPNVAGISYFLHRNMSSQFQYPVPITDILTLNPLTWKIW
jgi:hypothetical protein